MIPTHFIANKRQSRDKGFAITLYRFSEIEGGKKRPEYLGPLGWSFHMCQKDVYVLKRLHPIEKLEDITGDNLVNKTFTGDNIYAG